jgi:hypothetical protein
MIALAFVQAFYWHMEEANFPGLQDRFAVLITSYCRFDLCVANGAFTVEHQRFSYSSYRHVRMKAGYAKSGFATWLTISDLVDSRDAQRQRRPNVGSSDVAGLGQRPRS